MLIKPQITRGSRLIRLSGIAVLALLVTACEGTTQTVSIPTRTPFVSRATSTPETRSATVTPQPTKDTAGKETWASTSPDGKWIAEGFLEGRYLADGVEKYHTQLKVASADGTVEWIVVDEMRTWGLGYTAPEPFHWSRDGRYLYYTNLPRPDGCVLFINGSDLHRVDLTDGSVTEIVPEAGPVLSLSPDEKMLTYISWGAGELVLRDLVSESERRVALPDVRGGQTGNIVWSPDGAAIMLVTAPDPCDSQTRSIVRVDTQGLSSSVLVRDDDRLFTLIDWPEPARARLSDKVGNTWWLDAVTGQLTPTKSKS